MRIRVVAILAIIILGLALLYGCRWKSKTLSDVTFMYWADSPQIAQKYTEWLTEYRQSTKKNLEEQYAPFGEGYNQKLLILIGAKQAPDLFLLPPDYLQVFKEKGALMPLDNLLQEEEMSFPDPGQYADVYGADGKLYAIPINQYTTLVIFSHTEKVDITWDLLKFLLKKLQSV